jgi:hypothetical protein
LIDMHHRIAIDRAPHGLGGGNHGKGANYGKGSQPVEHEP